MVASNRDDIWDAFDEAVERAETGLQRARDDYEAIEQLGEPLPEVYSAAFAELGEEIQSFDSVFNVTDAELERAEFVMVRAEFLAATTAAYREFYESVIDRRVAVVDERFRALDVETTVAADRSTLARQIRAVRKLADAGKHSQLRQSDRVDLDDVEDEVGEFDSAVRDAISATEYVQLGLELAETFHDHYTDDLSALLEERVHREAISVADHLEDTPEREPIADRLERGDVTDADADSVRTILETYAEVMRLTGTRRAKYTLGESLVFAVEDGDLVDDTDELVAELQARLDSFEIGTIEDRIVELVEGETVPTETERLRQILAEHDGSVRRTLRVTDRHTDQVFDELQTLFEDGAIADLEVRFE